MVSKVLGSCMTDVRQDKLMNLAVEGLKEYSESQQSECIYLRILSTRNSDRILVVHSYRRTEERW